MLFVSEDSIRNNTDINDVLNYASWSYYIFGTYNVIGVTISLIGTGKNISRLI